MFNIESLNEIVGASNTDPNPIEVLTSEQCAVLLVAESVQDMCRPIRRLSTNGRIAIQQQFNRTVCLMIKDADASTSDSIIEMAMQAAQRVQSANQSDNEEAALEAVERLERLLNFYQDLAANTTRNSFYRREECLRQETAAHDSHVDGIDGAVGAYETKSKYAGWKRVSVETSELEAGALAAVDGIVGLIAALLPMASAYFQGLMGNKDGKALVQLGYNRLPETKGGEVEYERFFTVADVWADIQAKRREIVEPMSADVAAAAFKLPTAKKAAKAKKASSTDAADEFLKKAG